MNSIDARLNRLKAAVATEHSRRPPPDAEHAEGMERYKRRRVKEIKRALRRLEKPTRHKSDFDSTEIYFIECGDFIKIGHSTRLGLRLSGIGVDNPHPVVLLHEARGTIRDEKMLHEHFAHLRHRGEWFRRDAELLAFIEKLKAAHRAALPPEVRVALEVAERRERLGKAAVSK
jgi:Meiotically Up-regulated Gene 113 (MUG113) protein